MGDCKHDCKKPSVFPKDIWNRPALDEINYRIGSYSSMREYMLDQLNKNTTLQALTHRGADDPAIALLEGNAIVGDILSFYQNLYANEVFLRTADWKESVAELVQLSGYRLAPGVGGEAVYALKVKGDHAVVVPKGFGIKVDLEGNDKTSEFETISELTAYPELSEFYLYRPRFIPNITIGTDTFMIPLDAISDDLQINEDDRLLVGIALPDNASCKRINNAEIVIVANTWESFGYLYIKVKGGISGISTSPLLIAFKLDRSFRHFGHTATPIGVDLSSREAELKQTTYQRSLNKTTGNNIVEPPLDEKQFILDQEVDDLAGGKPILIQATLISTTTVKSNKSKSGQESEKKYDRTLVRNIKALNQGTYTWGPVTGSGTVVELDDILSPHVETPHGMTQEWTTDIRTMVLHEVASKPFIIQAAHRTTSSVSGSQLYFYGKQSSHKILKGRVVQIVKSNGQLQTATVVDTQNNPEELKNRDFMRRVTLDHSVNYEDYEIENPDVTVYGNIVNTTQGKSQKEVVLGNGDSRQTFQTFAIPKAPLTYLLDESQTPAPAPELDIYVEGILWYRVDTFFNNMRDDQIYVVREDKDGKSYVQFGDGKTGARLPSGRNNVIAIYRTGVGATGVIEEDTTPSATGKLKELEKVFMPGEVVGGDEAEGEDNAREAAPGKMQSLGRLVGLADFEAETRAIPGVLKVRADWTASDGIPLVHIVVLTETGTLAAVGKVQNTLNTYNRCCGPARFPVQVVQGNLQYIYLKVRVGYGSNRKQEDVEAAIKIALGLIGEEGNGIETDKGLFSLKVRYFGQGVHRSQIIAAIQQVDGVTWVEIDDAQALDLGVPPETGPNELAKPVVISTGATIACLPTRILTLHSVHYDLGLTIDDTKKECEA